MINKLYQKISLSLTRAWYQRSVFLYPLWPFSKVFESIARWRYRVLRKKLTPNSQRVPVVVIGNLTVGGSGKTPMVMGLVNFLRARGYTPGIVSRGYAGNAPYYPYAITAESSVRQTGDEALLLYRELACPVVIDPHRENAVKYLLKNHTAVNIILADDGLQHYALPRDYEIIVVDGTRGFGNAWCLPAGPLREPVERLRLADLLITQGATEGSANFILEPQCFIQLQNSETQVPLNHFFGQRVHAVAAIGNPQRFFADLQALGMEVIPKAFPDHYWFRENDLHYNDNYPVIMTAKDAIKCLEFAHSNCWYLQVTPLFNQTANERLQQLFKVI